MSCFFPCRICTHLALCPYPCICLFPPAPLQTQTATFLKMVFSLPFLFWCSLQLSQRADPVNITPESTRTGKVSSPTVNISAHVSTVLWAAFLCVPKNFLSPTWAVPTPGWLKLPGSAVRSGSVMRMVPRTPWRTGTTSWARGPHSMPQRWS